VLFIFPLFLCLFRINFHFELFKPSVFGRNILDLSSLTLLRRNICLMKLIISIFFEPLLPDHSPVMHDLLEREVLVPRRAGSDSVLTSDDSDYGFWSILLRILWSYQLHFVILELIMLFLLLFFNSFTRSSSNYIILQSFPCLWLKLAQVPTFRYNFFSLSFSLLIHWTVMAFSESLFIVSLSLDVYI